MRCNPIPQIVNDPLSKPESAIWRVIKKDKLGVKFRKNVIVMGFLVTFYCEALRLILDVSDEFDETDEYRDNLLNTAGYTVLRVDTRDSFNENFIKRLIGSYI